RPAWQGRFGSLRRTVGPNVRTDRESEEGRKAQMIKASVLLALMYCAMLFLKRRPAAERHILWLVAMASAALLPLLTSVLPSWQPLLVSKVAQAVPDVFSVARAQDVPGQTRVHALGIEPAVSFLSVALPLVWIAGSFVTLLALVVGCLR